MSQVDKELERLEQEKLQKIATDINSIVLFNY